MYWTYERNLRRGDGGVGGGGEGVVYWTYQHNLRRGGGGGSVEEGGSQSQYKISAIDLHIRIGRSMVSAFMGTAQQRHNPNRHREPEP